MSEITTELTRGQKAARTRAANRAAKAAEAKPAAKKVDSTPMEVTSSVIAARDLQGLIDYINFLNDQTRVIEGKFLYVNDEDQEYVVSLEGGDWYIRA